ncbi:hypothetical protein L9F63_023362 [Diploptera punctata]|uniref:Uncharacterized protein n=1 Tax=Diploptera punctata TaxID=6984 RepID=A0AAD8E9C3_DIPPU|nr:hypothetical protein L9F63_023362 [Diploptera punctata]
MGRTYKTRLRVLHLSSVSNSTSSNTDLTNERNTGTDNNSEEPILDMERLLVANYEYTKGKSACIRQFIGVARKFGTKDEYVSSMVRDEDTISKDQIAKLLPAPKEEKGNIFD